MPQEVPNALLHGGVLSVEARVRWGDESGRAVASFQVIACRHFNVWAPLVQHILGKGGTCPGLRLFSCSTRVAGSTSISGGAVWTGSDWSVEFGALAMA